MAHSKSPVNLMEELEFSLGFICGPHGKSLNSPGWWDRRDCEEFTISHDPRLSWNQSSDSSVALLGHAIDVRTGSDDTALMVESLAKEVNSPKFQKYVNDLCGRFILIWKDSSGVNFQTDAVGLRSAYFSDQPYNPYIASHEALVAKQLDVGLSVFGESSFLKNNNMAVMPGRATRFQGVKALTPNTSVEMFSRVTSRVFNGDSVTPMSVRNAAKLVISDAHKQIPSLRKRGPIRISLSAGLDSRVTTAMLREVVDEIEFFTYDISYVPKNNASRYDLEGSIELAKHFGLNHRVLDVSSPEVPDHIKGALDEISKKSHSRPLANAYLNDLQGGIHIRSHVYEVARSSYRRAGFEDTPLTGGGMLTIMSRRKSKDKSAIAAYEEYIEETDFESITMMDPLDALYWEHRMGRWMVPVINESSLAHETHVIVNCRNTLIAMLGIEEGQRRVGSISDEIISTEWPELFDLPVNGKIREVR